MTGAAVTSIRRLLSLPRAARRLGVSPRWLSRHLARLQRDHDFPAPLVGLNNRWSERAINNWAANHELDGQQARLIALAEVARRLGMSRPWLSLNIDRLVHDHGFPPAVPGFGTRRRESEVAEWISRRTPRSSRSRPAPADAAAWAAELDRRAEELAALDVPEGVTIQ
jgi:predicted DNA-binding transcriptional regulator AlpA